MYESDITRFIRELHQKNPGLEADQVKGRALLWDKQLDRDEQMAFGKSRVNQTPYVYQNKV